MKPISILWAKKVENGEKNFNDVPAQLKDEVMQKITEDGYTVDEEGKAILNQ
jgi:hypothetical protein